jgi:nucleoid-associated protein YejK
LPLDESVEGAYYFLEKNIARCMKNAGGRPAKFKESSAVRKMFLEYRNRSISFLDFATQVARRRYDFKEHYEIFTATDLFLCEVSISDQEFVVGLELACKEGMVHHVTQDENGIQNNLLVHQSIVPGASLSNANFFMIDLDKLTLTILESLTSTADDDTYLYADKILECETKISIKEAVKTARFVADEVVEQHELNKLEIIPAFERVIKETINEGEDINLKEIAEEVFFEAPEAKSLFIAEVESHGIDQPVTNQNYVKMPLKKTQRLRTDTGIEISIPLDYYNNKEFIEVVNMPDGRLAIQIKNIGNIENK